MPTFDGESYGLSIFFRIQGQIEASFFLGVCERTVERYISKFLVNGGVKPEPVGRSYGSISFAPREELIFFAYQIWKPQFHSVVQFPFDNCHSPFSLTTFFEIGVYMRTRIEISSKMENVPEPFVFFSKYPTCCDLLRAFAHIG